MYRGEYPTAVKGSDAVRESSDVSGEQLLHLPNAHLTEQKPRQGGAGGDHTRQLFEGHLDAAAHNTSIHGSGRVHVSRVELSQIVRMIAIASEVALRGIGYLCTERYLGDLLSQRGGGRVVRRVARFDYPSTPIRRRRIESMVALSFLLGHIVYMSDMGARKGVG